MNTIYKLNSLSIDSYSFSSRLRVTNNLTSFKVIKRYKNSTVSYNNGDMLNKEQIDNIINYIKKEDNLKFLIKYAEQAQKVMDGYEEQLLNNSGYKTKSKVIKNRLLDNNIPENYVDPDNGIYTKGGLLKLSTKEWCDEYANLMRFYCKELNPTFSLDTKFSMNELNKNISNCIKILKGIFEPEDDIKSKSNINYYYCIAHLLVKEIDVEDIIGNVIQEEISMVYTKQNQKKDKRATLALIYTSLTERLGNTLIESYILKNPSFSKFLLFLKGVPNSGSKISESDESQFAIIIADLIRTHDSNLTFKTKDFEDDIKKISDYYMFILLYKNIKNNDALKQFKILYNVLKVEDNKLLESGIVQLKRDIKDWIMRVSSVFIEILCTEKKNMQTLFTIATETKVVRNQYRNTTILHVHPELINLLIEYRNINKPYFSHSKEYESIKQTTLKDIIRYSKKSFVHQSDHIKLIKDDQCYLNQDHPELKLVIDYKSLLYLLSLINEAKTNNYENYKLMYAILYEIEFPEISSIYNKELQDIYNKLITLGLNFNEELSYNDFEYITKDYTKEELIILKLRTKEQQDYEKLLYNEKLILRKIYYKIKGSAIYIKGLLNDCIAYLPYKYFINDGFLCSRGRFYYNADFLNIQLYPFSKAVLKPYKKGDIYKMNNKNREKTINIIKEVITTPELKEKISVEKFQNISTPLEKDTPIMHNIYSLLNITEQEKDELLLIIHKVINENNLEIIYNKAITVWLESLAKRKNRTLYVQSVMHYIASNILDKSKKQISKNSQQKHMDLFYELDATASGLQMLSILLRSKNMGTMCNLTGEEKSDIYTQTSQEFHNKVQHIFLFLEKNDIIKSPEYINNQLELNSIEVLIPSFNSIKSSRKTKHTYIPKGKLESKNNNINKQIKIIINHQEKKTLDLDTFIKTYPDLKKILYNYLLFKNGVWEFLDFNLIINELFIIKDDNTLILPKKDINYLLSLRWILSSRDNHFIQKYDEKPPISKQILKTILVLRTLYKLNQGFKILGEKSMLEFCKKRTLFKDAIMTYFYNSTAFGRKQVFHELMEEHLRPSLNKNSKSTILSLNLVASTLELFFSQHLKPKVKDSLVLFQASKLLSKNNQGFILNNTLFKIIYKPIKYESYQLQLPSPKKGVRGRQIVLKNPTDIFSEKEFLNGFIPNFIHSNDAFIVHKFIKAFITINKELKKNKLDIEFNYYTNHDTFGSNLDIYLKTIIEDCYLQLIKAKPHQWVISNLKNLELNLPESKKELFKKTIEDLEKSNYTITKLNPNFVK